MNAYLLLISEALLSVAISLSVLHVLSRPLVNVLARICPDEQAAVFWLTYSKIMLMIAPLLFVLILDLFTHFSNPLDNLRFALVSSLGGMLMGLYAIGTRLGQFVVLPQTPGSTS
ncbi:MAG TPA: hypothetical protein VF801_00655 [Rhodocyclaceae bacterium]